MIKIIAPISHGVIGAIIFAAVSTTFTAYYEPARIAVLREIPLYWLLIAVAVFAIIFIGLINKVRHLRQEICDREEEIADMKKTRAEKKREIAKQNSRAIEKINRSARNRLKW